MQQIKGLKSGRRYSFEYDGNGNVIRSIDGNVTTYDYDNDLNCIRMTDAEQGITGCGYNSHIYYNYVGYCAVHTIWW